MTWPPWGLEWAPYGEPKCLHFHRKSIDSEVSRWAGAIWAGSPWGLEWAPYGSPTGPYRGPMEPYMGPYGGWSNMNFAPWGLEWAPYGERSSLYFQRKCEV